MDFLVLNEQGPASWQRFLAGARNALSNELAERWERVRSLGVNPDGVERVESIVTEVELHTRRQELDQLLAAGSAILESAAAGFSDGNFVLLLADRDGVVLRTFGGGEFASHARRTRLIEGADWGEEVRGTNAIGTALTEARPVIVAGCAHFERTNHGLICYSYPIRNPAGEVVAVLDATSHSRKLNPLAKAAISMAALAVEEAWRNALLTGLGHGPAQMTRELERIREPAFFVVPGGAIASKNAPGKALAKGRPPSIQQTLGLPWAKLREKLQGGEDTLELAPTPGVRERPIHLKLEPIFDGKKLVGSILIVTSSKQKDRVRTAVSTAAAAPAPTTPAAFAKIFGHDRTLTQSLDIAARFARSSLPILLLAETGTGKDLMAHAIHDASHRAGKPFVAVNCGALTPSLLESELFGYGPGAFTGASPEGRMGRLAAADKGTLFLDEVGEMPSTLQTLLLRVLEGGTYNRVGELETRTSDIRLICATCRDLPAMVEAGTFRKDLYYRIRGACLTLPTLRDREDVPELARHLLEQLCARLETDVPRFATDALRWMNTYTWPGNVRELKNALHHALVLANGADELEREHFPEQHIPQPRRSPSSEDPLQAPVESIEDAERRALLQAMEASDGNVSEIARQLGVARSTVYRMLKRHQFQ